VAQSLFHALAERDPLAAIQELFHPAYEIEPDSALAWANSFTEPSMWESLVRNGLEN
jgi:hypothetical protein